MKSFACFPVLLLARFVVSDNIPSCAPAQVKYCVLDDCLQALTNQTTSGPQFCGNYLENGSISIPDYIPAAAPASRISSACSCLIQAQPTAKPTAHSSFVSGSIGLSVTIKASPSLKNSVTTIPSATVSPIPISSPVIPESGKEYTTSIIYSLSTYTTYLSGQLVTKTQSVVDSTTVYPVTHEITQSPNPKSTAPVEYTTSTVYALSSYTNPNGEVVTKTIVDYTTVCPVTAKTTSTSQALRELASEYTTAYVTSTIYKVSTYTTLGQTITKTLVDYSTVVSITEALSQSPTPKSTIEYTTSTVYSLSTKTYTSSEKTFTVTDTVVDYTTVCPVSQSASSTQSVSSLTTSSSVNLPSVSSSKSLSSALASESSIVLLSPSASASTSVFSSSIAVESTKTRSRHSRTKCTKASHSTQSYPFGNSTSLYQPTGTGNSNPSSTSGTAYSTSVKYPMSNSTTSDLPQGTATSTAQQVTDSTRLQFPSGTGYSATSTAYAIPNSTSSYVPSGSGYLPLANSTTTEILPTSTSSLEINSSTSELPETTEISITSAPSTTPSPALPSVTSFCSTDAAALVFAAAGTPVTSYCSNLLSIQPTYADEQYLFVTKTTLITTTTTVSPATVTVFKRTTSSDSYPFTSTYDLAQQSSACSCLSIQPEVIAETITITVPATSLVVVSTTVPACTPSPTQVVVNGDFETATSGSYQTPWIFSSLGYLGSNADDAFTSYAGDKFSFLYGQRSTTATISQQIDTFVPGQSYTLSYYMSVMGIIALPTTSCVLSASNWLLTTFGNGDFNNSVGAVANLLAVW
ncbi:hypothetical protein BOTCAL_0472g00090 [Botryotinia calthae]|uniref:Uncharacterized protein n=1 Tax=Botryotinia calthae TaxID=38488 RepID=A0A4Y8CMB6_9HELO|nr:hypothetical protein BOTCAL_0472g00090 [Botryotinia calthae]